MSTDTRPLSPTNPPTPPKPPRPRWLWITAIATAVVVVAAVVGAVLLRSGQSQPGAGPAAPVTATTAPAVAPTGSGQHAPGQNAPNTGAPPISGPATPSGGPQPGFAYQPLYPFASAADAANWQLSYRAGGHSPWHRDAGLTAQSFAQGYLGYTGVNLVTSRTVTGSEAWIGVGYPLPTGQPATAAVIHLVRIGTGVDAPWEVVGTRDTTLTVTRPGYGTTVHSPVTVGGRITGVDESLRVQVVRLVPGQVGQTGGVPAGGQNAPWSVPVSYTAPGGSVLTIAVSTGGHVADVERFAVTGVRAG